MVAVHRRSPSPDDRDSLRVRRAQAGDPLAFDELIEAHRDLLEQVVRHFVRNGADVEDVTQEAWMRAATHIRDLREPSRFRPWLRTIARNSCMTFLRRQKGHRAVATLDDEEAPQIADSEDETPEAHLLSRDEQRKVWETLGALSERDRTALFYREYQGMPYAEIAERLNIARNAAEVCVFRARERFRRLYHRVECDEERCEFSGLQLSMYMDGELDDVTQRRVMKHLSSCSACTQRIEAMMAGRDIYRRMAGLVAMPGTATGILAGLKVLLAEVTSWFGGGGTAAAGTATAGTASGGTAAVAAASVTTATTGAGAAAAAGGISLPAVLAGPVAASVIVGAVIAHAAAPAEVVATEDLAPVTSSAAVIDSGHARVIGSVALDDPATPATPERARGLGAEQRFSLEAIGELVARQASAERDSEPGRTPDHAANRGPQGPRANEPQAAEAAAAAPGTPDNRGNGPPEHAAASAKRGNSDRGGPPEHAAASARHGNGDRGGPPPHAAAHRDIRDGGNGPPTQVTAVSNRQSPADESGASDLPDDDASIVRGAQASTDEAATSEANDANANATDVVEEPEATVSRPGKAPEHSNAGGKGKGKGQGNAGGNGRGNGPNA